MECYSYKNCYYDHYVLLHSNDQRKFYCIIVHMVEMNLSSVVFNLEFGIWPRQEHNYYKYQQFTIKKYWSNTDKWLRVWQILPKLYLEYLFKCKPISSICTFQDIPYILGGSYCLKTGAFCDKVDRSFLVNGSLASILFFSESSLFSFFFLCLKFQVLSNSIAS